jgi:hypothetical protein
MLSQEALELAKLISIGIWQTYDNTYGYATDKISACEKASLKDPENINFFWGQFDPINQSMFELVLFNHKDSPAKKELTDWIENYHLEVKKYFSNECPMCGGKVNRGQDNRCSDCGEVTE